MDTVYSKAQMGAKLLDSNYLIGYEESYITVSCYDYFLNRDIILFTSEISQK